LLRACAGQLFDWIMAGRPKVAIGGEYPLDDAVLAHAALESRSTTGKLLLIP
jgi:NADPH2:quinone reductase